MAPNAAGERDTALACSHESDRVSTGRILVRCFRNVVILEIPEQAFYRKKGIEASITDVPLPIRA